MKILRIALAFILVACLFMGAFLYTRPLPPIKSETLPTSLSKDQPAALPWPAYGQSAVGAAGYGLLATNNPQVSAPTASVAKVITALAVLKQKPLALGEQGPILTMTTADVAIYNSYYSLGGSVARVASGETISEYQALQALMLPSANNFADSLAIWAFGSVDKYIAYTNQLTAEFGLKQTKVADASGFSSDTMSSAQDLVVLGLEAIKNPVLAQIVSQQQADIPIAGTVRNVNWLLGVDGVNGIKTGDTDAAGGCYLFSALRKIEGKDVTVVGAIMGAPSRNTAITNARPLVTAMDSGFKLITPVKAGQVVGNYKSAWGGKVNVIAGKDLSMLSWKGSAVNISISGSLLPVKSGIAKGANVGQIKAVAGTQSATSPVILSQKINQPSITWRIFGR